MLNTLFIHISTLNIENIIITYKLKTKKYYISVDRSVWEQLIGLYPCLVECTIASASGQVTRSLREALLQYHDLLKPPLNNTPTSTGV